MNGLCSLEGQDEGVSLRLAKSQFDDQQMTPASQANMVGHRASWLCGAVATSPLNAFNLNTNQSASASAATPKLSASRARTYLLGFNSSTSHLNLFSLHLNDHFLSIHSPSHISISTSAVKHLFTTTKTLDFRSPVQGKARIFAAIAVTVDIGDEGDVGVVSSPSRHGHDYGYGEARGGVDQKGAVGMDQRGMGNGRSSS